MGERAAWLSFSAFFRSEPLVSQALSLTWPHGVQYIGESGNICQNNLTETGFFGYSLSVKPVSERCSSGFSV